MLTTLKALHPSALAVFNHLTDGLDLGGHRKLDNASGTFMAVCVEKITERHYSIAHYFEQNGDLMADPEMTFFKSDDGAVRGRRWRAGGNRGLVVASKKRFPRCRVG